MRAVMKRLVAIVLVLSLMVAYAPKGTVKADDGFDYNGDGVVNGEDLQPDADFDIGEGDVEGDVNGLPQIDKELQKEVNKEAKALNIPNAYYKRVFAEEYNAGTLKAPAGMTYSVASTDAGYDGIMISGVDTGVLANTKIDLGEYDFGSFKVGRVVYNMLAKKNMKGKGYLYFGDSETAFATINVKRCADESLEATRNYSVDLRNVSLSGKGHIYLKFVANSALNSQGEVVKSSGKKGNLFMESIFFIRDTLPVLDFSLDNEINSIEKINGSDLHTTTGYGDVTVRVPSGYKSEYGKTISKDATYELDYLKGRGNSTWRTSKKPYKMKLDKAANLFGMGSNKNWVLLANYYDYTMMRNKMTYDAAADMGLEFSPKSVFVDVVIDGEYYGCYQLSQQIRVDKANVNIDDLEKGYPTTEPDITGGYLLTLGTSWLTESLDTSPIIKTDQGDFRIDRPEYDDCPEASKEAQINYVQNYLDELCTLVNATASANAEAKAASKEATSKDATVNGKNWRDLMDENSFIDYFFMQAFSRNGDAYSSSSTYLYKKRNGKLYWGPVWDFDWVAWGARTTADSAKDSDAFYMFTMAPWIETLVYNDKEFRDNFTKRWYLFKSEMEKLVADNGKIDQYADNLYYSALANYQVRPSTLMEKNGSAKYDADGNNYTLNYYNEVNRLKRFIKEGIELCDSSIGYIGGPINYSDVEFYVDDNKVAEVSYDAEKSCIDTSKMPADPVKKGYIFDGWRFDSDFGDAEMFDPEMITFDYSIDGTAKARKVYAMFIPESEYVKVENIKFPASTLYLSASKDEEGVYIPTTFFVDEIASITPLNYNESQVKWYVGKDAKHLELLNVKGGIDIDEGVGERVVKVVAGKKSATLKIVALPEDKIGTLIDFSVKENVTLPVHTTGDVGIKFNAGGKYVEYTAYTSLSYKTENPDVATVDRYGYIHAVGIGKTKIYTYKETEEDGLIIKSTVVKVTAAKPANVTVKSAVKKGKNKVKLTFAKVNNATGYQVQVYKSEADAKASKNVLLKKDVKKTTNTLTSKKFKKNNKLYVKVRAYNKDKQYSGWTTVAVK